MPGYFENYDLNFIVEDEDAFEHFLTRIVNEGKRIKGYYGIPMYYWSFGDPEFWVYAEDRGNNSFHLLDVHAHCGGNCLWKMLCSGMDITPKDKTKTGRTLVLKREDGNGFLPIHVITADVLPSFQKDDPIKVQVVAQPITIEYYANYDEYRDAQPKNEKGEQWLLADGSLLGLSMMYNHNVERFDPNAKYENDGQVHFTATVKRLLVGMVDTPDQSLEMFVRCFVETEYGPLEFDHTIDQVPENMRKNIKVGAVIHGVCEISGDVAILEYENGPIFDAEHNLSLVRQALTNGEAERLRCVLSEKAVYSSEISGKTYVGPDAIIERINGVYNKSLFFQEYRSRLAFGKRKEDNQSTEVPFILLSREFETEYESAVFVDTDEDGMITGIRFLDAKKMDLKYPSTQMG